MKALTLLNEHLDMIQLGNKMYPKAKVDRVYARLSTPKTAGTFYAGDRARGKIEPDGLVDFEVNYPEMANSSNPQGWSLSSPEEVGIRRTSPKPTRDLIAMHKAFQSHLKNPDGSVRRDGAGLYSNMPLSTHRASAYEAAGFKAADDMGFPYQVLDNRRFRDRSVIAELLAIKDSQMLGENSARVLREDLVARHPQIKDRVEAHVAASNPFTASIPAVDYEDLSASSFYDDEELLSLLRSL